MAGDWIKIEHTTTDKPEVIKMAAILKIDQDAVTGKLLRLWIWADQNSVDGADVMVTHAFIDRLTDRKGFAAAMVSVGWLSGEDGELRLPNFERHNGKTAKSRSETARRVAGYRARNPEAKETIPRPLRAQVIKRDGNTCVYCSRPGGVFTPPEISSDAAIALDHVIPESKGGVTSLDNLVCSCVRCNRIKGDRDPDECGFQWPHDSSGRRLGNAKPVTSSIHKALPREEKRREEQIQDSLTAREAPSLEQVEQWAESVMAPPDCAETFWNEMEGCGWVDGKGRPVIQPRPAFNAYATRWKANNARSMQRSHGGGKPSPTAYQEKPTGLFGSTMDKYRTNQKQEGEE
jgi:5-methylcytosine-specific restriction endonuclease McrA